MDKRELLQAVLNGEEPERIPCAFWHHFSDEDKFGENAVKAHLHFYAQTDVDILKVMNEHMYRLEGRVEKPGDWKNVRPIPFERTPYPPLLSLIQEIRRRTGGEVPILATIHGVFVSAYHATEKGNFSNPDNIISSHMKADPEAVSKGLSAIAETLGDVCERCLEAGADGIYYAALGAEEYRFAPGIYETYIKPHDIAVLERIRGRGIGVLHICKDKVRLPVFQGYPADIVNWAVYDCSYPLASGRDLFPDMTLLGGFDDRSGLLVDGSGEEIAREVRRIVRQVGRRKLILGADCTLPGDVAYGRVRAVLKEAAKV